MSNLLFGVEGEVGDVVGGRFRWPASHRRRSRVMLRVLGMLGLINCRGRDRDGKVVDGTPEL